MRIAAKKVVTIDYTLTDDDGNVLDRSMGGHFTYLHGAGNIIPGLENALTGRASGDELGVAVAAEQAYGARDESKTQVVARAMFPEDVGIEVGMQFHAEGPQGENLLLTIAGIEGDDITVDGNHPLAGVNLNFQITVVGVRDATEDEVGHGHVHGPGGHEHD